MSNLLQSSFLPSERILEDYLLNLFFKPMVHIPSYVMAIITAYLLTRYSEMKWSRTVVILGWTSSILLKLGVLVCSIIINIKSRFLKLSPFQFTVYPWNKGDIVPTVTISALYGATCRTVWSSTVAWDIIACVSGHGGTEKKVLRNRVMSITVLLCVCRWQDSWLVFLAGDHLFRCQG